MLMSPSCPVTPRSFRITKEDIERVGYSDGCEGGNAMRASKPAQRHSEYCRRRVQDYLQVQRRVDKGSGRRRSDSRRSWSEQVRELSVWECERQCVGMRKGLHRLQPREDAVRRREPPVRGALVIVRLRRPIHPENRIILSPLRSRRTVLMMAGGRAKQIKIKMP